MRSNSSGKTNTVGSEVVEFIELFAACSAAIESIELFEVCSETVESIGPSGVDDSWPQAESASSKGIKT